MRREITREVAKQIERQIVAGVPADRIAVRLGVTQYVVETMANDPDFDPKKKHHPDQFPQRNKRFEEGARRQKFLLMPRERVLRKMKYCPVCGTPILLVPCRVCSVKQFALRKRKKIDLAYCGEMLRVRKSGFP